MKTDCVIIDNYDSFTYNLVHLIKELGVDVMVVRNNQFSLKGLNSYDRVVSSPGPGVPSEVGLLLDIIHRYAGAKPILGVCLGHQATGGVFGAKLKNPSDVFHGVATETIQIVETPLFAGLPKNFLVERYRSWVVKRTDFPDCLETIAGSKEGLIIASRRRTHDIYGIQFHPESVLTSNGKRIMANWLHA